MWNSLARSLVTCLIHDKWLCEKPWMNTISGPLGLPQSCAEIVSPSGAFTATALNCFSCAPAEITPSTSAATEAPASRPANEACVMTVLPCLLAMRAADRDAESGETALLEPHVGRPHQTVPRQRAPSAPVVQGGTASKTVVATWTLPVRCAHFSRSPGDTLPRMPDGGTTGEAAFLISGTFSPCLCGFIPVRHNAMISAR